MTTTCSKIRQPAPKVKLRGQAVAEKIRREIVDGQLPGGDADPPGGTGGAARLSRIPVREAFTRLLEAEGLVMLVPNSSAWSGPSSI